MRVSTKDPATPAVERYLVSRPVTSPLQLVGRATRGHWAVHADTERLVFLKDTWRRRGEQEGTVIADLNAAGVRNVPQFVAEGDVYQHPSVLDKSTSCNLFFRLPLYLIHGNCSTAGPTHGDRSLPHGALGLSHTRPTRFCVHPHPLSAYCWNGWLPFAALEGYR